MARSNYSASAAEKSLNRPVRMVICSSCSWPVGYNLYHIFMDSHQTCMCACDWETGVGKPGEACVS